MNWASGLATRSVVACLSSPASTKKIGGLKPIALFACGECGTRRHPRQPLAYSLVLARQGAPRAYLALVSKAPVPSPDRIGITVLLSPVMTNTAPQHSRSASSAANIVRPGGKNVIDNSARTRPREAGAARRHDRPARWKAPTEALASWTSLQNARDFGHRRRAGLRWVIGA